MSNKKRSYESCAVVTGAGSGIGKSFALQLAERGGHVVCSDIDLERAQQTVKEIKQKGGKALALKADVSILVEVELLSELAQEWLDGPIDLVVNNAGVGAGGKPIGEIPMTDWQWVMGVNLWGVVHGCHVFAPQLKRLGRGGIINVCSTASFAAAPGMGPYCVSKAAVLALSETLSAEMSGTSVAVTALCPTFVKTNIAKDGRITSDSAQLAAKLMERGMSPDRVTKQTLNALDKNKLYVLPQLDARTIWRTKRWFPVAYARGIGVINRYARGEDAS